jgi:hypothetical protein
MANLLEYGYLWLAFFVIMITIWSIKDILGSFVGIIAGAIIGIVLFYFIPKKWGKTELARLGYLLYGVGLTLILTFNLSDINKPLALITFIGIPVLWFYIIPKKYNIVVFD